MERDRFKHLIAIGATLPKFRAAHFKAKGRIRFKPYGQVWPGQSERMALIILSPPRLEWATYVVTNGSSSPRWNENILT